MHVLAAVSLPPPIHGQSLVNAEIVRRLNSRCRHLQVIDVGPGNRQKGLKYHFQRISQILKAAWTLPRLPAKGGRCFYTSFEAGMGVAYNFVLIGLARCLGYRIIVHHHTSAHTLSYSRLFEFLTLIGGRDVVHVVLSNPMAMDLKSRYPRVAHTIVCNNACHVLIPEPHSARKISTGPLVIGILANLSREKGLDAFLETLAAAYAAGLNIKIALGGPLMGKEAVAIVERNKKLLGAALEIRGPVYGEAKVAFFRSIDVFFYPTQYMYEAQPLVIFEAMSYGLPIISTDRGYIAGMMGAAGVVVGHQDDLLAIVTKTLNTFIESPETFSAAGDASIAQFLTMHQHAARELEGLIDVIMGSGQGQDCSQASA